MEELYMPQLYSEEKPSEEKKEEENFEDYNGNFGSFVPEDAIKWTLSFLFMMFVFTALVLFAIFK